MACDGAGRAADPKRGLRDVSTAGELLGMDALSQSSVFPQYSLQAANSLMSGGY